MSEIIVSGNIGDLIDQWLEAESKGVEFPVPFDVAWQIAGYARKDSAKRKLLKLSEGNDFHKDVEMASRPQGGGAKTEIFYLTCDAMKHFCLMAETEEGQNIRQYFIEAEKKWRLVQKIAPKLAEEIELMQLKVQLTQAEAQKETAIAQAKQADFALTQFRHTITQTCTEPVQQKILGYQIVKDIEYRDRIISDGEIVNDGGTLTKTELCHRYSILTKNGKPDFKRLNAMLKNIELSGDPWELSAYIRESQQFRREYLPELDEIFLDSERQLELGE